MAGLTDFMRTSATMSLGWHVIAKQRRDGLPGAGCHALGQNRCAQRLHASCLFASPSLAR
jgi:hypothetical protein